jgi:hypothetical protein
MMRQAKCCSNGRTTHASRRGVVLLGVLVSVLMSGSGRADLPQAADARAFRITSPGSNASTWSGAICGDGALPASAVIITVRGDAHQSYRTARTFGDGRWVVDDPVSRTTAGTVVIIARLFVGGRLASDASVTVAEAGPPLPPEDDNDDPDPIEGLDDPCHGMV